MSEGDFKSNEKSLTVAKAGGVKIVLTTNNGSEKVLKEKVALLEGEIIDATVMRKAALTAFLKKQVEDAKNQGGVLFSLHMKATMMKVSDPIIFGHAVEAYFEDVFSKHQETFDSLGISANDGLENLFAKLSELPNDKRTEIETDIQTAIENGPDLAMVNSDKGITNLHVPSDIIIDASMPAMIRNSGQMWNKNGQPQDTKAVIPDSSYADIYTATIEFCKKHGGAFDPTTMGTVPNVGLMAQKAEEYGSHDKTFEIDHVGAVQVIDLDTNKVLIEHHVEQGDIWRMCQVKDAPPIQDWSNWPCLEQGLRRYPPYFG